MARFWRSGRFRFVAWGIAAALVFILLAISLIIVIVNPQNETHLSAYQDGWEDLSKMRDALSGEGYETRAILNSLSEIGQDNDLANDPDSTLLVIIGVESGENPIKPADATAMVNFVSKGGKLIIADDFGYANNLLTMGGMFSLGAGSESAIRFSNHRLYDPNYEKNPDFVLVNVDCDINDSSYQMPHRLGPYTVMLNQPTMLKGVGQSHSMDDEVVARSSSGSWVDENDNGLWDPFEEEKRSQDVMALQHFSTEGMIFYVSDPGLFINDMWDRADNAMFVKSMVALLLPDGGRVIFDESQHSHQNPLVDLDRSVNLMVVKVATNGFCITGIILILLLISVMTFYRSKGMSQRFPSAPTGVKTNFFMPLPEAGSTDLFRLRALMLETLRTTLQMTIWEFARLGTQELETHLAEYKDKNLLDLFHYPYTEKMPEPDALFRSIESMEDTK